MTPTFPRCSIAILIVGLTLSFASTAIGQEEPSPRWKGKFDEVKILNIDPDELPGPEESTMPDSLSAKTALPRPTSLDTLRKSSEQLSEQVIEVIVVPKVEGSLRRSATVIRGEAVWLSSAPDGKTPLLVTNAHYLMDAQSVFVRPAPRRRGGQLPTARRRTLNEMNLGADVKALLRDPSLVAVSVENVDKHRNLATLRAAEGELKAPVRGIVFFPIDDEATSSAYGFSHQMGSTLVVTQFLIPSKKRDELLYYLQTSFPVILGAPIVSADGRIIAMTAMRHPADPTRTLVIPPRALRKYVAKIQDTAAAAADAAP